MLSTKPCVSSCLWVNLYCKAHFKFHIALLTFSLANPPNPPAWPARIVSKHIKAESNWLPICRRHFQRRFLPIFFFILIPVALKFDPYGPIDNESSLVHLWGAKPLPEPMITQFTRPQCVKWEVPHGMLSSWIYFRYDHSIDFRWISNLSETTPHYPHALKSYSLLDVI